MTNLNVEIVTPEAALWTGSAQALMARSSDGEFTILPQHTPIVGDVVPGLVRVSTATGELAFCVHGGFFQVGPDETEPGATRATVLAGTAEALSDIDVTRAQAAKDQALAALASLSEGPERTQAEAELARAELRLSLAR